MEKETKKENIFIILVFFLIIIFLVYILFINNNKDKEYIKTSQFPLGLIYEEGYCVSNSFVENSSGEIRKIVAGNKFLFARHKENIYILVNEEVWKVIFGNFSSISKIEKHINFVDNNIENENFLENVDIEQNIIETIVSNINKQNEEEKETNIISTTPTPIIYDIEESNNYFKPGDYVGNIRCNNERINLNTNIVYGESQDIIDKFDICISKPPGSGIPMFCGGHSTNSLSKLKHIEINDIITIETNYGIYEYKVTNKNIGYVLPINESSSEDFLKDIYTNEELFIKKGNKEILQIYTCIYLNKNLEVVEVNEENTPTKYRLAIKAELVSALKKEKK